MGKGQSVVPFDNPGSGVMFIGMMTYNRTRCAANDAADDCAIMTAKVTANNRACGAAHYGTGHRFTMRRIDRGQCSDQ